MKWLQCFVGKGLGELRKRAVPRPRFVRAESAGLLLEAMDEDLTRPRIRDGVAEPFDFDQQLEAPPVLDAASL
jgi:hypothetical protein